MKVKKKKKNAAVRVDEKETAGEIAWAAADTVAGSHNGSGLGVDASIEVQPCAIVIDYDVINCRVQCNLLSRITVQWVHDDDDSHDDAIIIFLRND